MSFEKDLTEQKYTYFLFEESNSGYDEKLGVSLGKSAMYSHAEIILNL